MVEDLTYLSYNKVLHNFEKLTGQQINHIITFLDWYQQLAYHWADYGKFSKLVQFLRSKLNRKKNYRSNMGLSIISSTEKGLS